MNILPAYNEIFNTNKRFIIIKGGGASGKTYALSQKIILDTMATDEPMVTMVIRKCQIDLRHSVYSEVSRRIEESQDADDWIIKKKKMEIIYKPNRNKITFYGLDSPEPIHRASKIWIDDASEITESEFDLVYRYLDKTPKATYIPQICLTFNPLLPLTKWIKERFFDKKDSNALILETSYKDNLYISEEIVKVLEEFKKNSPFYYKAYALGEWAEPSKRI